MSALPLSGFRILVVEDDALIALLIEDLFLELGCAVVGPAHHIAEAVRLAETERVDGAILDINVGDHAVYPAADVLMGRGVPIVFASGHHATSLPERFRDCPVLAKPFDLSNMQTVLTAAFVRA